MDDTDDDFCHILGESFEVRYGSDLLKGAGINLIRAFDIVVWGHGFFDFGFGFGLFKTERGPRGWSA